MSSGILQVLKEIRQGFIQIENKMEYDKKSEEKGNPNVLRETASGRGDRSAGGHRNCTGWEAAFGTPGKSRKEHQENSSCRCGSPWLSNQSCLAFLGEGSEPPPLPPHLSANSPRIPVTPQASLGVDIDTQVSFASHRIN